MTCCWRNGGTCALTASPWTVMLFICWGAAVYVTCATGRNHLSVVVVSLIRSDDPESLILVTLAESATDGAIIENVLWLFLFPSNRNQINNEDVFRILCLILFTFIYHFKDISMLECLNNNLFPLRYNSSFYVSLFSYATVEFPMKYQ